MTEIPLKELQAVFEEFEKEYVANEKTLNDKNQKIDKRIANYQELLDNPNVTALERYVTSYFALNESHKSVALLTQQLQNNILLRFMIFANTSIISIADTLSKMEKAPISQNDKETIENLKKQLTEIQKSTSDMQPYVDMLRTAIEKKNKWLKENR